MLYAAVTAGLVPTRFGSQELGGWTLVIGTPAPPRPVRLDWARLDVLTATRLMADRLPPVLARAGLGQPVLELGQKPTHYCYRATHLCLSQARL